MLKSSAGEEETHLMTIWRDSPKRALQWQNRGVSYGKRSLAPGEG